MADNLTALNSLGKNFGLEANIIRMRTTRACGECSKGPSKELDGERWLLKEGHRLARHGHPEPERSQADSQQGMGQFTKGQINLTAPKFEERKNP